MDDDDVVVGLDPLAPILKNCCVIVVVEVVVLLSSYRFVDLELESTEKEIGNLGQSLFGI